MTDRRSNSFRRAPPGTNPKTVRSDCAPPPVYCSSRRCTNRNTTPRHSPTAGMFHTRSHLPEMHPPGRLSRFLCFSNAEASPDPTRSPTGRRTLADHAQRRTFCIIARNLRYTSFPSCRRLLYTEVPCSDTQAALHIVPQFPPRLLYLLPPGKVLAGHRSGGGAVFDKLCLH